jgi:hypothetical protein
MEQLQSCEQLVVREDLGVNEQTLSHKISTGDNYSTIVSLHYINNVRNIPR